MKDKSKEEVTFCPAAYLTDAQLKLAAKCKVAKEIKKQVLEPDWERIRAAVVKKTGIDDLLIDYMAYALEYTLSQALPAHRSATGGARV